MTASSPSLSSAVTYRAEIDGLRAVAVLPVVLYHADVSLFKGGYVGVDIFFVISGYLITSIIIHELEHGRFSLLNFYERRARRILPALFFLMAVCLPIAWLTLLPNDMKDFSQSLVAVSFFISNFLFYIEGGYFEQSAELKPLLHTWSLAVEEQFYVFFPLFLIMLRRLRVSQLGLILFVLAIISFSASNYVGMGDPDFAFYMLPTRAWELLIGAICVVLLKGGHFLTVNRIFREFATLFGLFLIFISVFGGIDVGYFKDGMGYAIAPTFGAAFIIIFSNKTTVVAKMLSAKPAVTLGLISYSVYLWHQPILSFLKHAGISEATPLFLVGTLGLIFVIATFSTHYIERPFRKPGVMSQKSVIAFVVFSMAGFSAIGVAGHVRDGRIGQLTASQEEFLKHFNNDLPDWEYFKKNRILEEFREDCNFYDIASYRVGQPTIEPVAEISESCFTPEQPGAFTVFLWGDSHAQMLFPGLKRALPATTNLLIVASSGCPAQIRSETTRRDYCSRSNVFALETISRLVPDVVVIGQNRGHDLRNMKKLATRKIIEADYRLRKQATSESGVDYVSLIEYFCDSGGCLLYYGGDPAEGATSWDYGHLTPLASHDLAKNLLVPLIVSQRRR